MIVDYADHNAAKWNTDRYSSAFSVFTSTYDSIVAYKESRDTMYDGV